MSKILVFSAATKNLSYQYDLTNPNKKQYCDKFGYDFIFEEIAESDRSFFYRYEAVRRYLKIYDYVMWMDVDAWFNDFSVSLEDLIKKYMKSSHLLIARDICAQDNPKMWIDTYVNSGVFIMKSGDIAVKMLDTFDKMISPVTERIRLATSKLMDQFYLSNNVLFNDTFIDNTTIVEGSVMNWLLAIGWDGKHRSLKIDDRAKNAFVLHAAGLFKQFPQKIGPIVEELIRNAKCTEDTDKKKELKNVVDKKTIIVSFTTLPNRMGFLKDVLTSITSKQTLRPDKVVLYITKDDFKDKPESIKNLEKEFDTFECRLIDENYGVATKLIPALKDFPNNIIVNIDDDIEYKYDLIENLYESYLKNDDCIITACSNKCFIGDDGKVTLHVNESKNSVFEFRKGYDIIPLSGHGTLYPPHIFDNTKILDFNEMKKRCPTNDEQWLWANAIIAGKKIVVCGKYHGPFEWATKLVRFNTALSRTVNTPCKSIYYLKKLTDFIIENSDFDLSKLSDPSYTYVPTDRVHKREKPIVDVINNRIIIPNHVRSYGNSLHRFRNFDFSKVH